MEIESIIMNIIAYSGEAKATVYSALEKTLEGDKEEGRSLIEKAREILLEVHKQHGTLLSEIDLNEVDNKHMFLLIHAEDIFMSTNSECELVSIVVEKTK